MLVLLDIIFGNMNKKRNRKYHKKTLKNIKFK